MKKPLGLLVTFIAIAFGGAVGNLLVRSSFQHNRTISSDETLVKVSKNLNAAVPIQIDKDTRLDSTLAGPGNRFTYFYTLVNRSSGEIDRGQFSAAMSPMLVNKYRTSPVMATFRKIQTELCYSYRDKNGNAVTDIAINPSNWTSFSYEPIPEVSNAGAQQRKALR